jgi:hypothetical protein
MSDMALKPWYEVVTPREDLREERPLDASEFAVYLDQVRDGTAPKVYRVQAELFERTFLTRSLGGLASEVVHCLSDVQLETSAVFNLSTQVGRGKTHAQSVFLYAASHSDSLKRFIVEEEADGEGRFWKLAQPLAAFNATGSDEERCFGVLACNKACGYG